MLISLIKPMLMKFFYMCWKLRQVGCLVAGWQAAPIHLWDSLELNTRESFFKGIRKKSKFYCEFYKLFLHTWAISNNILTIICVCVFLVNEGEDDGRDLEKLEEKIWDPNSSLTEKQIDQFLVVAR